VILTSTASFITITIKIEVLFVGIKSNRRGEYITGDWYLYPENLEVRGLPINHNCWKVASYLYKPSLACLIAKLDMYPGTPWS